MASLLPISFSGYDSIIYFICALISFLIAYKGYKLYDITGKKNHFYFYLSFSILSVGFLTITLTSAYTYVRYLILGQFVVFDPTFGIEDVGYWIYFVSSFVAYLFLAFSYIGDFKKIFMLHLPITISYYSYFNVVLFFMIAYVAFRGALNYFSKRSFNSFLVMGSFGLITLYHGLLLFTAFSKVVYVVAHVSLIVGFLGLLWMLVRVSK